MAVDLLHFVTRCKRVSTTPGDIEVPSQPELVPCYDEGFSGHLYIIDSPNYPAYRIHYTPVE